MFLVACMYSLVRALIRHLKRVMAFCQLSYDVIGSENDGE